MTASRDLDRLRQWCDELEAEPMWTMSLGSKELFGTLTSAADPMPSDGLGVESYQAPG